MGLPLTGVIRLTDSKPQEIKAGVWAKQATKDMLPNREDVRFPFKTSSLVCPFCGDTIDGECTAEPEKSKKKPWEIRADNLRHETNEKTCSLHKLRGEPFGHIIEKILLCHIMTHAASGGTKNSELLHSDPSIPKLHTEWDEDDQRTRHELAEAAEQGVQVGFSNLAGDLPTPLIKTKIPKGDVQRLTPTHLPDTPPNNWKEALKKLPTWETEHPEDPTAPKMSGWVCVETEKGKKAICGYLLPKAECEDIPETYPIPLFRLEGPEQVLNPNNHDAIPYLEVQLLTGPAKEGYEWIPAATVKRLKNEEKVRRKTRIAEEIAKLPKDRIWEGFCSPKIEGLHPELDQPGEPQQTLPGFRPGGDVKKWWLPGIGNPHAKIWILGLYPSNEEIKRKGGPKILSGPSGTELFRIVAECGLDPKKDVFFENIVKRYLPPKSKLGAEIKAEQTWLLQKQIHHYQPERIICLGAEAFKELASKTSFPNTRGSWVERTYGGTETPWSGRVAATFHPAYVLRPEGRHNLELFRHDLKELLLDKTQKDVNPEIREFRTVAAAREWGEQERAELDNRGQECIYVIDTEGFSLESEQDEFVCIQFSKIWGTYDRKSKRMICEEVPKRSDILLFKENPEPEHFDGDAFPKQGVQEELSLLLDEASEPEAATTEPAINRLANTEEERREIITAHGKKHPGRALNLFTPYKKIAHLCGHEKEVGEILTMIWSHPKVVGFACTNTNFDRIRLEKRLGVNMGTGGPVEKNGGIPYPLDTMLAEHLLDENGDLGLKPNLNKHFGWPRQNALLDEYAETHNFSRLIEKISDPERQSEWNLYPWRILRPYSGKDSYGAAALLAHQLELIDTQTLLYQKDRLFNNDPNTLDQALHIQCGGINGTYEMHRHGMPVGKRGMEILEELTDFYQRHEADMVAQYKDAVFRLTGLRDANPSSPEELGFVLFNENSPLKKYGIEPWKESGRGGRIWSEIPHEERGNATPSTDAESLEIIASSCQDPEIQKFLLRLSETKTILTIRSSFLPDTEKKGKRNTKGLIGRINPNTLCMHTSYTPTLDTNRCRSIPNLSTFPKDEIKQVKKILGEAPPYRIREIIQAPEGALLLNRDWTTAEVLGLGYLSEDPNMLQIIARMAYGMDFHCKLAVQTYEKIREAMRRMQATPRMDHEWVRDTFTEDTAEKIGKMWVEIWDRESIQKTIRDYEIHPEIGKKMWVDNKPYFPEEAIHAITKILFKQERSNIKPVTFGVPYGREAAAIQKQLNREYYVNNVRGSDGNLIQVTLEESQSMIDSYKTGFSTGWGYLEEQARHALEKGFLRDHWGYIRHFPQGMKEGDVTRKAYNYQIQHIVAALMNQAMNDWTQERARRKLRSYAYATLYDNIGWVVYMEELQEVWDLSMQVMTTNRPVGPRNGSRPHLADWRIPTSGELSREWEGPKIKPESVGINPHHEMNLTGTEGKF